MIFFIKSLSKDDDCLRKVIDKKRHRQKVSTGTDWSGTGNYNKLKSYYLPVPLQSVPVDTFFI